jgi:hypothetical protein
MGGCASWSWDTYEKHVIEEWLQRNATSPLTRNRLTVAMLQPNRALGTAIEEFVREGEGRARGRLGYRDGAAE